MAKVAESTLTLYGVSVAVWRDLSAYGFTSSAVDYRVAVIGASQDKMTQVSRALHRRLGQVLGKTPEQIAAASGEVASTLLPWALTALTTPDP